MSAVVQIARLRAKEGREKQLEAALKACTERSHNERGITTYALHRDVEDARTYVLIEGYDSVDAVQAHAQSKHLRALLTVAKELLEKPLDLQVLRPLVAGESAKGTLGGAAPQATDTSIL